MQKNAQMQANFEECLRKNPEAAEFYNSCTPQQKKAIEQQVRGMCSARQVEAFVSHLPSATL